MSEQNHELTMAIADSPRIVREYVANLSAKIAASDARIQELEKQLADAKAMSNQAFTELSSLTTAQQACIGCAHKMGTIVSAGRALACRRVAFTSQRCQGR